MSEYGSGISFARACAYDKERIKEALKGRLLCGEDENGFIFKEAPKEECEKFIIKAFDNAVYHARGALAAGRAMDNYLKSKHVKVNMKEYMYYRSIEEHRDYENDEYKYDIEDE
ncbi:MAG TPA: hypothetical protein DCW44_02340 [Eubacterium sp.]|nr:hypothetical protein [Eubacterium sp.]